MKRAMVCLVAGIFIFQAPAWAEKCGASEKKSAVKDRFAGRKEPVKAAKAKAKSGKEKPAAPAQAPVALPIPDAIAPVPPPPPEPAAASAAPDHGSEPSTVTMSPAN
ncbi:MAG TPA: hypothetical protein P5287_03010 [bacterium]|nr:hypothetical protein [bacterium]